MLSFLKPVTILACFHLLLGLSAAAQSLVQVEAGPAWQTRNEQRIRGNEGTLFSIADWKSGPLPTYRVYFGHKWNSRHELRALYAPLEIKTSGEFDSSVRFLERTYAANTQTTAFYKFNSYRLTYAYHLDPWHDWNIAIGFTAKIRDAEVRLTQGNIEQSSKNLGFVPLLNFQAMRELPLNWKFRMDLDGLAAPQGRAFDLGLFFEHPLFDNGIHALVGYRTLEGGADNDKVYSFAWFHTATAGIRGEW